MPDVATNVIPRAATSGAIAKVIGVSVRAVNERKAAGAIPGMPDGSVDVYAILTAGLEILAKRQKGAGDDDLDLNAERARLAKEQADAQEMKNALARSEVIPRQDVVAGVQATFAAVRARVLAIPTKAAPLLLGVESPAAVREILTEAVHECCGDLAATRAISTPGGRPVDGRGDDGEPGGMGSAAEADGERVGGSVPPPVRRGKRRTG